jgi:hypothetical protein|tara:strand:+ start:3863 stop:4306 length:444 start_codon:yes stop_codon:yes gene_type:complete
MVMGNMLRDREVQYIAMKDETTQTWRILDSWNDSLKSIDLEDDIDDSNPAVKVLTEGEFIALIKEAGRLGILANATYGTGAAEFEAELLEKDQEIQDLNTKITALKEEKSQVIRETSHSEDYELKEKAMNSILKLVSMQDMSNLGRE